MTGIIKVHQMSLAIEDENARGMTISTQEKEYHCGRLVAATNENILLTSIKYFTEWPTQLPR